MFVWLNGTYYNFIFVSLNYYFFNFKASLMGEQNEERKVEN